jgi:hypothetical protein
MMLEGAGGGDALCPKFRTKQLKPGQSRKETAFLVCDEVFCRRIDAQFHKLADGSGEGANVGLHREVLLQGGEDHGLPAFPQ